MELYYKIRFWSDFIIPIAIFAVLAIVCVIGITVSTYKAHRIKRFFIKHGYERYCIGVPAFGNGSFYGWKRESVIVDDRDIRHMTFKIIKKRYS